MGELLQNVEFDLTVQGDVQGVGYRQYVANIGRKLKLAGFVKNLKNGMVQIQCKGDEKTIREFKEKINKKNPDDVPLIYVEDIEEIQLAKGTIEQTDFEEIYDESTAEMSQGFSTGMRYINLFRIETHKSFKHMDEKYDAISKGMFAVADSIEERNKTFESRMEKTEKNIESLLKILSEKKS